MENINKFISIPLVSVTIATIIAIAIVFLTWLVRRQAYRPKLRFGGSTSLARYDGEGRAVKILGLEVYNSTSLLFFLISRETAQIHGYDLYSPLNKDGHSIHLIWKTHEGISYDPVNIESRINHSVDVYFLAYYENEPYYYIIQQVVDDKTVILGPDKIRAGSLKLTLVFVDNIGRKFRLRVKPIHKDGRILPDRRLMSLETRLYYMRQSLRYLKIGTIDFLKIFQIWE